MSNERIPGEPSKQEVIDEAITFFRSWRIFSGECLDISRKINTPNLPEGGLLRDVSAQEILKAKQIIASLERGDIAPALDYLEKYQPEISLERHNKEIRRNMEEMRVLCNRLKYYGQ